MLFLALKSETNCLRIVNLVCFKVSFDQQLQCNWYNLKDFKNNGDIVCMYVHITNILITWWKLKDINSMCN